MGSFAALGALSGAAKGWVEGSDKEYERKQNSLDQVREERLATLKHNRQMSRDEKQQEYKVQTAETLAKSGATLQEGRDAAAGERSSAGDVAHGQRSDAEIVGRQEVADTQAAARVSSSRSSGSSDKDNWRYDSKKESVIDAEGNLIETDVKIMRDKTSNIGYIQDQGIFREVGDKAPVREFVDEETKSKAEAALLANPTFAQGRKFYKQLHYLPLEWFQAYNAPAAKK